MNNNVDALIKGLPGPILVLGSSGFLGANLLRKLLAVRQDVIGTYKTSNSWRLLGVDPSNQVYLDLTDHSRVHDCLQKLRPKVVFDTTAYGAYSFERKISQIHETNYNSTISLLESLKELPISAYIHSGSSSEYGNNCSAPTEEALLIPNSHYSLSKIAASSAILFYGKNFNLPVLSLRLYSVYGPYEDASRLIPTLCNKSLAGKLPVFASPNVSRDFIYIDDVISAFVLSAANIRPPLYGESINIGTGKKTTLLQLSALAKQLFDIKEEPSFNTDYGRDWDTDNWFANIDKASSTIGWKPSVSLANGLSNTRAWWMQNQPISVKHSLTKKTDYNLAKSSITAIIACYRDQDAIPIMYKRLHKVFLENKIDYQIIFVNDNSPDQSVAEILRITESDERVIGINHSRNFGSQAAFRSGMEIATKEAVVLMDGDLQDPPELIPSFISKWRQGYDVVFGRRVRRDMPRRWEFLYRLFYRIFSSLSDFSIPKDAGDFSLIDREVVYWLIKCDERDYFLRGLRAYVGFKQVGVDYVRPDRMFGASTNNLFKNIGWAKKAIFSFSQIPLHLITVIGVITTLLSSLLIFWSILVRLFFSSTVPQGLTFLSLTSLTFGSVTLLSLGLLGEYIGKIIEETKARPRFIRTNYVYNGKIVKKL